MDKKLEDQANKAEIHPDETDEEERKERIKKAEQEREELKQREKDEKEKADEAAIYIHVPDDAKVIEEMMESRNKSTEGALFSFTYSLLFFIFFMLIL